MAESTKVRELHAVLGVLWLAVRWIRSESGLLAEPGRVGSVHGVAEWVASAAVVGGDRRSARWMGGRHRYDRAEGGQVMDRIHLPVAEWVSSTVRSWNMFRRARIGDASSYDRIGVLSGVVWTADRSGHGDTPLRRVAVRHRLVPSTHLRISALGTMRWFADTQKGVSTGARSGFHGGRMHGVTPALPRAPPMRGSSVTSVHCH